MSPSQYHICMSLNDKTFNAVYLPFRTSLTLCLLVCYLGIIIAQGEHICNLPCETGPCKAYIRRFCFDEFLGKCREFIYGGCLGNANNFKTLAACRTTCQEAPTCLLPRVTGPCYGYFPRYYFDGEAGECKEFIYGGCLGNANNFETEEECIEECVN